MFTTRVASWVGPCATILCLDAKMEMVSIPSRTIDDSLHICPVAVGNDHPPLWDHGVEGCVDMVTYASNVPTIRPNLVGVLAADSFKRELLIPRVSSTVK